MQNIDKIPTKFKLNCKFKKLTESLVKIFYVKIEF